MYSDFVPVEFRVEIFRTKNKTSLISIQVVVIRGIKTGGGASNQR